MRYNTQSRVGILEFLKKNKDKAFSAEEIATAVLSADVGRSTVFRRLAEMTDEGDVRRMSDAATRKVTYQYIDKEHCAEHLHLKCKSCGKLIHLDGELSRIFEEKIFISKHFRLDHAALLSGVCESCTHRIGGAV